MIKKGGEMVQTNCIWTYAGKIVQGNRGHTFMWFFGEGGAADRQNGAVRGAPWQMKRVVCAREGGLATVTAEERRCEGGRADVQVIDVTVQRPSAFHPSHISLSPCTT